VVAVSVCIQADDGRVKTEEVLKFLKEQKATFTNLLLDEKEEFWQKKFNIAGPPTVYVFDREGKWQQFKGEGHYPDADKLVAELLQGS
jgi:hypothetical protein